MQLLDQLLQHDAWTTRQLLDRCASLSDEQLDQEFDIGHRSLRATFEHIIRNMEVWSSLISQTTPPQRDSTNASPSVADLRQRLKIAAERLSTAAHEVAANGRWNETYVDPIDEDAKRFGTSIAHLMTHSMHHRAQLLYLMRRIGIPNVPEGDVFSWEAAECNS